MSAPAVFFDRDGVLVEEVYYPETGEWEAPLHPADVRLTARAADAARRASAAGYKLIVISNQGGFAKGKTSLRELWLAHERFVELMAGEGVSIHGAFYAYGHPEGQVPHFSGPSLDRKPGPYNLYIAAAQHDLDLEASWMVGDRLSDLQCAAAAGLPAVLVENANNPVEDSGGAPRAPDVLAAVEHLLAGGTGRP